MAVKHSPEPWKWVPGKEAPFGQDVVLDAEKEVVFNFPGPDDEHADLDAIDKANAERAIACVNALVDMDPRVIAQLVAAAQGARDYLRMTYTSNTPETDRKAADLLEDVLDRLRLKA